VLFCAPVMKSSPPESFYSLPFFEARGRPYVFPCGSAVPFPFLSALFPAAFFRFFSPWRCGPRPSFYPSFPASLFACSSSLLFLVLGAPIHGARRRLAPPPLGLAFGVSSFYLPVEFFWRFPRSPFLSSSKFLFLSNEEGELVPSPPLSPSVSFWNDFFSFS